MSGRPAPRDDHARFVLVGRPNAGKSTLYNLLTKGNTKVGNFPGVTVDILEGELALHSGETRKVFDLPGVYTLTSHDRESDEGIACAFLGGLKHEPGAAIVQVLDATQLAVGLELTKELLAFEVPLALVVTQIDLLDGRVPSVDLIEKELDVPCVAVSARDPECRSEVIKVLPKARLARRDSASRLNPRELALRALPERSEPSRNRALTTRVDRVRGVDVVSVRRGLPHR